MEQLDACDRERERYCDPGYLRYNKLVERMVGSRSQRFE